MSNKFERYYATQSWFAKNSEIYTTPRLRALEIIGKKICEVMRIQRFGVWIFSDDRESIIEELTWETNGIKSSGAILHSKEFPYYMEQIQSERAVLIKMSDLGREYLDFADTFMKPYLIDSLMDAPIFSDGELFGVICCETLTKDYQWDFQDQYFVAICADCIGRIFEAEKRHNFQDDLKHRIDFLEHDLTKKIQDLKDAKSRLDESLNISRQSEDQLKSMIRSLPVPIAMLDKNLNYVAYSGDWLDQWGGINEVKVGGTFMKIDAPQSHVWLENLKRVLLGSTLKKEEDFVEISPEITFWTRWSLQPWKDAHDNVGGVVVLCEDITKRKEVEMKINQASKLSALGEMAGGIAHEINNPLSIIKGYLDLLKRHASRSSLTEELMIQYIDKMDLTVSRISRIVAGMRRFSRESSMDEKVFYSLNKVIDETLDICQERIQNHGASLKIDYFRGNPIVLCRPVELSQVILNLINNSFQAVSGRENAWIKIECSETQTTYQIRIIDSGTGVSASIRSKLFQPFFTTKDIGVGTGLGLSISRGIIEEHQGKLSYVESVPNTTFLIELPKANTEDK